MICNATEDDLPVLVDFLAKLALHVSGAAPQTLKENEQHRLSEVLGSALADANKRLIVAETSDARLVGMGYLYIWRSQGVWEQAEDVEFKSGVIDDVWVEPEFRKVGIFQALLRFLDSPDLPTFEGWARAPLGRQNPYRA